MQINKTMRKKGFNKIPMPTLKKPNLSPIKMPKMPAIKHGAFPKGLVC